MTDNPTPAIASAVDFAALASPFAPEVVSWRVGSTTQSKDKGLALAYIDARDVMERLDTVAGPANWSDRYEVHGTKTICYLSLRGADGGWITKADGAGDTDVEAEKGSMSDAFKRAAVKWGIGRYLYSLASPWVEIEARGKSYSIKASERGKLLAVLRGAQVASTPPPADDPPPTPRPPADNTEPPYAAKLKKVLALIGKAATEPDLNEFEQSDQFIAAFDGFPETARRQVTAALDNAHKALAKRRPVNTLMAG